MKQLTSEETLCFQSQPAQMLPLILACAGVAWITDVARI